MNVNIIEFLNNIDISIKWSLYGMAFSFVSGVITGYFFYALGKKEKKILRFVDKKILYRQNMSFFKGLKLSFDGKTVSDFAVSQVEIKNIGTEEIDDVCCKI